MQINSLKENNKSFPTQYELLDMKHDNFATKHNTILFKDKMSKKIIKGKEKDSA